MTDAAPPDPRNGSVAEEINSATRRGSPRPGDIPRWLRGIALFDRAVGWLSTLLLWIAGVGLVVMLAVMMGQVYMRNVVGTSLPGSVPIAETLLAVVIFGGLAHTQRVRAHVRVQILELFVKDRYLDVASGLVLLVLAIGVGWMAVLTSGAAFDALERGTATSSAGLAIPQFPARAAVAVGFAANAIEFLSQGLVRVFVPGGRSALPE